MSRNRSFLLVLAASLTASWLPACSSAGDEVDDGDSNLTQGIATNDHPWEVTTDQGETVLPNLFYAEASENEQVMPLTVHGRHQIDRLVYPTIGNPNLYIKSDPKDSLMLVMRIEEKLLAHLAPDMSQKITGTDLSLLKLTQTDASSLSFYLVDHQARPSHTESEQAIGAGDGAHVIRIQPSAIRVQSVPSDMPKEFAARRTFRVIFDHTAMANVPAGLYDVRFEVKKDGKILSDGGAGVYEFQYNAVRVFDKSADEYSIVNVTDTQVSTGELFQTKTLARLKEFVQRINASTEPAVKNAAFISFNGDLHNGGSPASILPATVAATYGEEATVILDAIKDLNLPIFLTIGNHDGYVATGAVPAAIDPAGAGLKAAVDAAAPKEWPSFSFDDYKAYLDKSKSDPGGLHLDIFTGQYARRDAAKTFSKGWIQISRKDRNMVLYDGFHQWHRTYGPAYTSWSFGKNAFFNLNTYDIRQHRRSGWGMYTVNYGGGMSKVQAEWLDREIKRVEAGGKNATDIVIIGHHDPRGGHNGHDYPYAFPQMNYEGMAQVTKNFVTGEIINKKLCDVVPSFAMSDAEQLSCLHDGLQEWMLADPEFDCEDVDRKADGRCDVDAIKADPNKVLWFSGFDLMQRIANHPSIRTLLLGHTHYNSLEILQSGDELTPGKTAAPRDVVAGLNVHNPIRAFSFLKKVTGGEDLTDSGLTAETVWQDSDSTVQLHEKAGGLVQRALQGANRELVVLRLTSNADLTSQKFCQGGDCKTMLGFSTFAVTRKADARGVALPQINQVTFFLNDGGGTFETIQSVPVARTDRVGRSADNNPLTPLFKL